MKLPVKELSRKLSCLFIKKRGRNPTQTENTHVGCAWQPRGRGQPVERGAWGEAAAMGTTLWRGRQAWALARSGPRHGASLRLNCSWIREWTGGGREEVAALVRPARGAPGPQPRLSSCSLCATRSSSASMAARLSSSWSCNTNRDVSAAADGQPSLTLQSYREPCLGLTGTALSCRIPSACVCPSGHTSVHRTDYFCPNV